MDPIQTGAWIAARRKEKDLTQRDLADRLGVTDKAVSRWETGKGYPDIALLPALAEALDCTINELLSGRTLTPEEAPAAAEENLTALCHTAGQPLPEDRRLFSLSSVEIRENRVLIRFGLLHSLGVFISFLMLLLAGSMIAEAAPQWSDWKWELGDIVELVVLSLWFLLSLLFIVCSLFMQPNRLVLDRSGVSVRRLFRTRQLSWDQIRDYGVAFFIHDRDELLYFLYFADSDLESDEIGRKKLNASAIQVTLQASLLDRYVGPIMDFCAEQTDVLPFLVYPYDRLRFQCVGRNTISPEIGRPSANKRDLRLHWAAVCTIVAELLCLMLDRAAGSQSAFHMLSLLGAGISLSAGIAVLWINFRRLRRACDKDLRVGEFNWTTFWEVLILGLLVLALGAVLLVLLIASR